MNISSIYIENESPRPRCRTRVRAGRRSRQLHTRRRCARHHAVGREPEAETAGSAPRQAAARAHAACGQAGRRRREFPAGRPRAARRARPRARRDLGRHAPARARRQRACRRARPAGRAHEPASAGPGAVARNASRNVDEPARAIRRTPVRCGDRAARAGRGPAARRRHVAVCRAAGLARRAGLGTACGRAAAARSAGRPVRRACGRAACTRSRGAAVARTLYGRGVAAVTAAAAAGLAVCPLARRVAPRTLVDVGAKFGLPPLPLSQVVLYSHVRDPRAAAALRRFADSLAISA